MTVDENAKPLDTKKAELYASFVAKVLWVMKRGRPDIEPTVSFLCTRVKGPDRDDWCKLKRLLCWTKKTVEDVRIIGADSLVDMLTFIDSAHAVHPDMRGHTGGATTFGTGIIDQKSSKQKMNSRSSTETEVIGNSEYLPKNIYFEMFMEGQGYKLRSNTLTQDNVSTMRMATNGRSSCTSNSKHISIKYFWVTDRVKNGNIEVVHCPTRQMIADYFSKALQGELFHLFRNVIMGWAHISTVFKAYVSPRERVENRDKIDKSVGDASTKTAETASAKMTYAKAVQMQNTSVINDRRRGNSEEH